METTAFKPITVMIPATLDQEFIDDVMCTALEGGISYWCDNVEAKDCDYHGAKYASDALSRGATLILHDYEDDECHELVLKEFVEGYKTYIQWAMETNNTVFTDPADIDAEVADMIVQFAIFGELIYG